VSAVTEPEAKRRWMPDGERVVRSVTGLARLTGLLALVSVLLPVGRNRLRQPLAGVLDLPKQATESAAAVTLVAGVGLLLLATGLRRRKRNAWMMSTVVSGLLVISHAFHPRAYITLLLSVLLLGLLLGTRRRFTARPDPGGRGFAVRVGLQVLFSGFVLLMLLMLFNHKHILGSPSVLQLAQQAAWAVVGVAGPLTFSSERLDDLIAIMGLTFGVSAVGAAAYFLLRSPEPRPSISADDEQRLRALLDRHGDADSLGYFALRDDKAAVFSPTGKSAITYRVLAGVALASGDPLGDYEAWGGAIDVYLDVCANHGWTPAVLGCSERGATVWARHGLGTLELGDEAVVDAATFTLQGRTMRGVRQAVARLERAGYSVEVRRVADVPTQELDELIELGKKWRGSERERGFSMALGRLAVDPACVVVTAVQDEQVRGLLHFVPWGEDGLSLDAMLRDREAENGLNELMITSVLAASAGLGVRRVSLNFAMFRAALERGEKIGAGPVAKVWAWLLRFSSRWWQIESLYKFNDKFAPQWVPRYVVYSGVRDLPRICLAGSEAEGFGGRPPALLRLLRK
jgi:lysyl-tRNA synthetase class 2